MAGQQQVPSAWGWGPGTGDDDVWVPPEIDTSVAHPARRYDYLLGGKDNFAVDRVSGDAVVAAWPAIRTSLVENRRFLARAVGYLSREAGISQFLDVGTGIPAADNTHEVAQRINPAARVVYVDNDPIVLAHARALLTSVTPTGLTAYIDGDLRDPDTILGAPELRATLDLSRPVGLMLVAILHFLHDQDRPHELVRTLVDALPAGSYLVMTHATYDYLPSQAVPDIDAAAGNNQAGFRSRNRQEFARFFDGHELIPPGIVSSAEWRAGDEPQPRPSLQDVSTYAAVARLHRGG